VIDLLDRDQGLGGKGKVAFPVDGDRASLARLVVELDVARLHLLDERLGLCL